MAIVENIMYFSIYSMRRICGVNSYNQVTNSIFMKFNKYNIYLIGLNYVIIIYRNITFKQVL